MRKNIAAVIESYQRGEAHREDTCRTDGERIWSYEMTIARRAPGGQTLVRDPSKAPSRTTKMQTNAILRAIPNTLVLPAEVES